MPHSGIITTATTTGAATVLPTTLSIPCTASSSSVARSSSQSIAQLLGEVDKRRKKANCRKKVLTDDGSGLDDSSAISRSGKKASGRTVGQQRRRVTPVPLDNSGRPVFPIELGLLTIYSLGEIIPEAGYYTSDLIYPVGFCSTRVYLSIATGPTPTCLYTCKVSDTGTAAKFEISPEDAAGKTFTGSSPSDCHRQLLEAINASRGAGTVPLTADSGAEFFGLSHPTVLNLIQSCAGARKCTNYRWVRFEVSRNDAEVYSEDDASVNVSLLESTASLSQPMQSVTSAAPRNTVVLVAAGRTSSTAAVVPTELQRTNIFAPSTTQSLLSTSFLPQQ
jgi:hypothetical protein